MIIDILNHMIQATTMDNGCYVAQPKFSFWGNREIELIEFNSNSAIVYQKTHSILNLGQKSINTIQMGQPLIDAVTDANILKFRSYLKHYCKTLDQELTKYSLLFKLIVAIRDFVNLKILRYIYTADDLKLN